MTKALNGIVDVPVSVVSVKAVVGIMKLADFKRPEAGITELIRLVAKFNDNDTDYPREATVHRLFEKQVSERPDAVAVVHGEREYNYRQLDAASNRFARFLLEQEVRREDLVAVLLRSPFELAVAILGILKAGGAYVPIDFDAGFEAIKWVLDDTATRILVSERRYIRMLNRLQWECPRLDVLFCVDSHDVRREPEGLGGIVPEIISDDLRHQAFSDISGSGCTSGYTSEWPSREMRNDHWVNIRAKLLPHLTTTTRVLEITCGLGMSLLRLAPLVGFYYATDLSRTILDSIERETVRTGLQNVRLGHYPPHETDRVEEAGFNVVILSGAVQYFSGHNYLREVLRQAIAKMADRGFIFLGNVWDLDKKGRFVKRVAELRANANPDHTSKITRFEELFVSRDFLEDLRHDCPEIATIECSDMLGAACNDLSKYGYDAILHIEKSHGAKFPPQPRKKFQFDLCSLEKLTDLPISENSGPEGLAHVIYTPGTSGQPKGVMVEHRAIARLVLDTNYIHLGPIDRILQTGSLAFNESTFEIWGALLNGGAFCRAPERAIVNSAEVRRLIAKHDITTMCLPARLFNQHVDRDLNLFAGLKQLLVSREGISPRHINIVHEKYPQLTIIIGYGQLENTTLTTYHRIERSYSGDIPIGRPIANTQVLILDATGSPVPVGIQGEICVAGEGLARGYLNDPELTHRKFVPHPWEPGERMYRTGDSGLWRADGTIELLGRINDQVEIRGHRIDPAEIEYHLLQNSAVKEALVLGKSPGGSGEELVAYITPRQGLSQDEADGLLDRLKRSLPDYIVPPSIIGLDRMPLNPNGEVDSEALPDLVPGHQTKPVRHQEPVTETERELIAILGEVLGLTQIGATDDFFDWGGHSLKVVEAISRIERRLGVAVPINVFFTKPTARGLAEYILGGEKFGVVGLDEAMVPLSVDADRPNLFAFPPGTGDALGYVQIASLLPYRFYGFNFIDAESRLRDYADLITRVDAEGPYLLFGYSSGGNLAYHVAWELEKRGRRVAAIIMVDSARKLQRVPISDEQIDRLTNNFLGDESVRSYLASPVLREKAQRLIRGSLRYVEGAVDYDMIGADIHVLTSDQPVAEYRDAAGELLTTQAGWADVTRGRLRIRRGVGDHNYMLAHPHLDRNAELIRQELEEIVHRL